MLLTLTILASSDHVIVLTFASHYTHNTWPGMIRLALMVVRSSVHRKVGGGEDNSSNILAPLYAITFHE